VGHDLFSVLELCGVCALAFWFVGFCMLWVAGRKARREFRSKGYMRPPKGTAWVPFLLWRRYEAFANPGARYFFKISHVCLMGMIVAMGAVVILLGCELLLYGAMQLPQ
jgi:hypothetical protein